MKINLLYIVLIILVLTIRAYIFMIMDKRKAIKGEWRISERQLFILAWQMGTFGIWLGMLPPVNHKKSKASFIWKLAAISVVQALLLYLIYQNFEDYFYFKM